MRNYNVYLSGMEKANIEKVFFLEHLDINDYDKIIDFGCARGDILKICGSINKSAELIGIDNDSYMREIAKSNVPNASFYSSLEHVLNLNGKTLIILNSVLHEIEDYKDTLLSMFKRNRCHFSH